MTTALEGGEGSESRPGRFLPPGKTRYPLYRRLDGPQGQCGQVQKILPQKGFDPRTVQSAASRYTGYATLCRVGAGKLTQRLVIPSVHPVNTDITCGLLHLDQCDINAKRFPSDHSYHLTIR